MNKRLFIGLALLFSLSQICDAYRRSDFVLYYIRGLNSNEVPNPVVLNIQLIHPSIPVVIGKIGDGSPEATKTGMYRQLEQLYNDAITNPALAGKHVIVFGSSQGGALAQAFVEMYADRVPFKIDSLITLASPIAGQFGLPNSWEEYAHLVVWQGDTIILQQIAGFLGINKRTISIADETTTIEEAITRSSKKRDILDPLRTEIEKILKDFVSKDWPLVDIVFYNAIGQDLISVAGYWKDPQNISMYQTFNSFLPYINNEVAHADSERYKRNLASLNRIVFIWAGLDSVVKPPCSGGKRFYQTGSRTYLERSFEDTDQYKQNLLNLGHMYNNGRLFIEPLPYDDHGCISGQGLGTGLRHFEAIVNEIAPNEFFDAIRANDLATVQNLVAQKPDLLFAKDGFNHNGIYYAGNKLAIAQFIFNQSLALGRPVDIASQLELAFNAVGSNSPDVLHWLIDTLHLNVSSIHQQLVALATITPAPEILVYLNNLSQDTLEAAVIANNISHVQELVTANPMLITQNNLSNMLPILYAGNKLEIAQYLFAAHLRYAPLTLGTLKELLYYAFGSGSLPVAQWIIDGLYFNPTDLKETLLSVGNPTLNSYLNNFLAQNRVSIFSAVQSNNLTLIQDIITRNPANAEEVQAEMLPIFYAGNKFAIAQYLYNVHQQLGRPLSSKNLGMLLYFACGSGDLTIVQWIIEQLRLDILPIFHNLLSVAYTNGQTHITQYLNSLSLQ